MAALFCGILIFLGMVSLLKEKTGKKYTYLWDKSARSKIDTLFAADV
jgi:hypothetical protein